MKIVNQLPDLMTAEDYREPGENRKIRVRITVTEQGIEVLGDSMYPQLLEKVLQELGGGDIEKTLCG